MLLQAIRYGDRPDLRERLNQVVADRLDEHRLQELLEERALARDSMDASRVQQIQEDMERAEARKLQPHFIASFFLEAFQQLGGSVKLREPKRYEMPKSIQLKPDREQMSWSLACKSVWRI